MATTKPTTPRKPRRQPAICSASEMLTPSELAQLKQHAKDGVAFMRNAFPPDRELTAEERDLLEEFGDG